MPVNEHESKYVYILLKLLLNWNTATCSAIIVLTLCFKYIFHSGKTLTVFRNHADKSPDMDLLICYNPKPYRLNCSLFSFVRLSKAREQ